MRGSAAVHLLVTSAVLLSPVAPSAAVFRAPAAPGLLPPLSVPAVPAPALTPSVPALPSPSLPSAAAVLPPAPPAPAAQAAAALPAAAAAPAGGLPQGALFDGTRALPAAAVAAAEPAPALPDWARIANPEHAAALAAILFDAGRSATGRSTLRKVTASIARRGRPLVFEFTPQRSSHAYVDWETDVVRMSSALLKEDPARAAPILVHELTHVLQKERRLPYHAFELEFEAFVVTLKVARELGVGWPNGDTQGESQRRFAGDLGKWVDWLRRIHDDKSNISLLSGGRTEFVAKLEKRRASQRRAASAARARVARLEATLDQMERAAYGPEELSRYRQQELEPAREHLRSIEGTLRLVERDLAILATPEGYAAYRRFVDAVMARARRLHASWPR